MDRKRSCVRHPKSTIKFVAFVRSEICEKSLASRFRIEYPVCGGSQYNLHGSARRESPMVRRVKVTRDGFTRCPACSSHIKVAVVLAETACPFCETALTASSSSAQNSLRQVLSRSLVVGRSGLIAASLLGLAATGVSCESGGGGSTDVIADVAPDLGPQPEYGVPADTTDP